MSPVSPSSSLRPCPTLSLFTANSTGIHRLLSKYTQTNLITAITFLLGWLTVLSVPLNAAALLLYIPKLFIPPQPHVHSFSSPIRLASFFPLLTFFTSSSNCFSFPLSRVYFQGKMEATEPTLAFSGLLILFCLLMHFSHPLQRAHLFWAICLPYSCLARLCSCFVHRPVLKILCRLWRVQTRLLASVQRLPVALLKELVESILVPQPGLKLPPPCDLKSNLTSYLLL